MIRVRFEDRDRVVVLEMQGVVSAIAVDDARRQIDGLGLGGGRGGAHGSDGGLRVLLDWARLEGWEPGLPRTAVLPKTFGLGTHRRVAIVADERWLAVARRLEGANGAPVGVFPVPSRGAAWSWLTGAATRSWRRPAAAAGSGSHPEPEEPAVDHAQADHRQNDARRQRCMAK
jgi:hypothetical protein